MALPWKATAGGRPKPTSFAYKVMETVGPNRGHGVSGVRSGPPGLGQGTQTPAQAYLCLVTVV